MIQLHRQTMVYMLCLSLASVAAADKIVVAMNPLSTGRGIDADTVAVSTILQAELTRSKTVTLVDREQMDKALNELKLGQQGMLAPDSARRLGKIVGAKYFFSGDLRKAGKKTMATVRVIDIETTLVKLTYKMLGDKDDIEEAGKALATQVEGIIGDFEKEQAERKTKNAASKAKAIPADWKRPVVMVIIPEMHVRQPQLIDPAGETEIVKRLLAAGFKVIDSEYVRLLKTNQAKAKELFANIKTSSQYAADKKVDVLLYGEAISERGAVLGDFEGCRGRVELKAIRVENDEILMSDSALGGATDLAETVAGKKAIQQAANRLADEFLYSLAEKWNK